ncbi:amino acid transporter heavy chain SLC3A2 [Rhinophrynus dorsalis]
MTQDTALDMKDVELNELDQEKIPMAAEAGESPVGGGGEKNGVVKVKLEDEDDDLGRKSGQKFTGLSKEELLRVAGTPGWVRVRWALLILFWIGWAGMLAGAVVIIVQAPRCKALPTMEWWNKGPLYQLGDPETFQDSDGDGKGDIQGIQQRLESLSSLKVKGLIIGPLHVSKVDSSEDTLLTDIAPQYGNQDQFNNLVEAARKKSIQVIIDLTPNYHGNNVWFNNAITEDVNFQNKVKDAINFWLERGVGGIYFGGIENLNNPTELIAEWRNITTNHSTDDKPRVLLVSTEKPQSDLVILNGTIAGQLSFRYLSPQNTTSGITLGEHINQYVKSEEFLGNGWMVGSPRVGHLASLVQEKLLHVYQLLLFTLPGTPITLYGDEIGLKDLPGQPAESQGPYMQWDDSTNYGFSTHLMSQIMNVNENTTFKAQEKDKQSILSMYKRLSELRGKERSLLHGNFVSLNQGEHSLAFLRRWDQNERYVTLLNFDSERETELTMKMDPEQNEGEEDLPDQGSVVLSSNPERNEGSSVSLKSLKLGAGEALLLKYPYSG